MRNFLRAALEDDKPDERPVIVTGPLSDAFTQALQQSLAKNEDGQQAALESQSQDDDALRSLANYFAPETDVDNSVTIYGVSRTEVEDENIVEISQELAETSAEQRDNFVVVIDGTVNDGANGEGSDTEQKIMAIESLVKAYGCKVYPSLEAYAQSRKR